MDVFWFVLGLISLIVSGNFLVDGAVDLAKKWGISKAVIGGTIVAFGTSLPEFLVSFQSVLTQSSDIGLGNVVGSNIANITLVLGVTALIFPIFIKDKKIKKTILFVVFCSVLFGVFAWNGRFDRWEGIVFLGLFFGNMFWALSRKSNKQDVEVSNMPFFKSFGLVLIGCFGLYFGAKWFVFGAKNIALLFGISERVIGLSIVAFGTSLPELVTSCIAGYKKESAICFANLIGSNLFNLLLVLGLTTSIVPFDLTPNLGDLSWLIGTISGVFLMVILFGKINRWLGGLLFGAYVLYVYALF